MSKFRWSIVNRYVEADRKMFMTMGEAQELSHELGERLLRISSGRRMLVGIANGALMMTSIIADDLGLPMRMVSVRRRGSAIKDKLQRIPGLVAIASAWYQTRMLNAPLRKVMEKFTKLDIKGGSGLQGDFPPRVVILDDVIETGQSINLVRDLLTEQGVKDIIVAVLIWSKVSDEYSDLKVPPDIYIGRKVQHFPWSLNSPYYKEYMNWVKSHGPEVKA
jgi:hypoxanthine-guanine phosphoribosyltransferase